MRYLWLIFLLFIFSLSSYSQTEVELSKKGVQAFTKKDYEQAKQDFVKLISLNPTNKSYNYYYGVSLLQTTSQTDEVIKFLKYASTDEKNPVDVYYYLGKAYHLSYRFKDAIRYYQMYQSKADVSEFDINREIQMCKNGQAIFKKSITDVTVLKKQVYAASEFYRLYDEREMEGSILVSTMDQSKVDKKKGYIPIIFYPKNSDIIFFASYGDKDNGQKDIYYKMRSGNDWSQAKLVQGDVNTDFDEDFPYYDANQEILYFSSKGHNSIGGYDIYRSKFNHQTRGYDKVKNLDFAISSTYDDLFYIPNKDNTAAWFASNRDNKAGFLTIYQVAIDRLSSQVAFIKGDFSSDIFTDLTQIKIELISRSKNKVIGTYRSEENGTFNIPIYSDGDYQYKVTVQKLNKTFDLEFNIPYLADRTEYRQKLIHKRVDDKDFMELIILDNNEIAADDDRLMNLLKEKSNLEVSDADQIKANAIQREITVLKEGFSEVIKEVEKSQLLNDKLNQKIVNNIYEINQLKRELKSFVATQEDNEHLRMEDAIAAKRNLRRIESIEEENKLLKQYADSLHSLLTNEVSDVSVYRELNKKVQLIPTEDSDFLGRFKGVNHEPIEKMNNLLTKQKSEESTFEKSKRLRKQSDDINQKLADIYDKCRIAETEMANLKAGLIEAKKKEQEKINAQIEDKQEEIDSYNRQIAYFEKKGDEVKVEQKKVQEINDLWTSISQVQVTKPISKKEVEETIEKNKDPNFNSIRKVISKLPDEDENLQAQNSSNSKIDKKNQQQPTTKEFISETFNRSKEEISKVTASKDKAKIREAYNRLSDEIELHKKAQEKRIADNPKDKEIQKQYAELQQLEKELQKEKADWEQTVLEEDIENPVANRNQKEWITAISPNYEQKIESINQKEYDYNWEKVENLKKSEEELLVKVQQKIKTERSDSLIALETNIQKSIDHLQNQLNHETDEVIQQAVKTSSNTRKAIQQLNLEVRENVFQEEINDLGVTISKQAKKLKDLQQSAVSSNKNQAIDQAISELTETLILLDEKQAEFRQLVASKTREEETSNTNNTQVLANNKEEDNLKKEAIKTFVTQDYPSFNNALENTLQGKQETAIQQSFEKLEAQIQTQLSEVSALLEKKENDADLSNYRQQLLTYLTEIANQKENWEQSKSEIVNSNFIAENQSKEISLESEEDWFNHLSNLERDIEGVEQELNRIEDDPDGMSNDEWVRNLQQQIHQKKSEIKSLQASVSNNSVRVDDLEDLIYTLDLLNDELKEKRIEIGLESDLISSQSAIADNQTTQSLAEQEYKTTSASIKQRIASVQQPVEQIISSNQATSTQEITRLESELTTLKTEVVQLENRYQNDANKLSEIKELHEIVENLSSELASKKSQLLASNETHSSEDQEYQTTSASIKQRIASVQQPVEQIVTSNKEVSKQEIIQLEKNIESLQADIQQLENKYSSDSDKLSEIKELRETVNELTEQLETKKSQIDLAQNQTQFNPDRNEDIIIDLNEPKTSVVVAGESKVDENYLPPHEASKPLIDSINQQVQSGKFDEEMLVKARQRAHSEVSNNQLTQSLKADSLLRQEVAEVLDNNPSSIRVIDLVTRGPETSSNLLPREIEQARIPSAHRKEYITYSVNEIERLDKQQDPTIEELLKEEKDFNRNELKEAQTYEAIQKLDDPQLLKMYNDSRLRQLNHNELQTTAKRNMVQEIYSESKGKDKKTYAELNDLLDKKSNYISAEKEGIVEDLSELTIPKSEDYEIRYYELEGILINYHRPNAEQVVLYETIGNEIQMVNAIKKQKAEIMQELLNSNTDVAKQKAIRQLEDLQELTLKLEKQIQTNLTLLEAEINHPTQSTKSVGIASYESLNSSQEAVTIHKVVADQSFQINTQQRQIPTVNAEDLKLILEGEDYPKGLFFRVQVGAFAKPINENVYSAFSPITMERLTGQLIKYMAGYFTEEAKATTARNQIRGLGFKDAFLVAYCDGVRIPIYEARRRLLEGTCVPVSDSALFVHIYKDKLAGEDIANMDLSTIQNTVADKLPSVTNTTSSSVNQPLIIDENKLTDAKEIKDMFFTVQVGVFNRYVESEYLKGLKPINTFEVNPKAIRHSVGIFDNIEAAKEQRLEAIEKGFTDAFIVAYMDGKRYLANEALKMLAEGRAKMIQLPKDGMVEENAETGTHETFTMQPMQMTTPSFNKEMKLLIEQAQAQRQSEQKTSSDIQLLEKKEGQVVMQFKVTGTAISTPFYWWLTHNFIKYQMISKDGNTLIYGYCDEYDQEDLLEEFQEKDFKGIVILQ